MNVEIVVPSRADVSLLPRETLDCLELHLLNGVKNRKFTPPRWSRVGREVWHCISHLRLLFFIVYFRSGSEWGALLKLCAATAAAEIRKLWRRRKGKDLFILFDISQSEFWYEYIKSELNEIHIETLSRFWIVCVHFWRLYQSIITTNKLKIIESKLKFMTRLHRELEASFYNDVERVIRIETGADPDGAFCPSER